MYLDHPLDSRIEILAACIINYMIGNLPIYAYNTYEALNYRYNKVQLVSVLYRSMVNLEENCTISSLYPVWEGCLEDLDQY